MQASKRGLLKITKNGRARAEISRMDTARSPGLFYWLGMKLVVDRVGQTKYVWDAETPG